VRDDLADLYLAAYRLAEAESLARETIEILERLHAERPDWTLPRTRLIDIYTTGAVQSLHNPPRAEALRSEKSGR
jgi:hypothetical protein